MLLDGSAVASQWTELLAKRVEQLKNRGVTPGLAVVLVGDDPASVVYTSMKERSSRSIGMISKKIVLPSSVSVEEVSIVLGTLSEDKAVHGILVQLPLPAHIDASRILRLINPQKDVDGLHPYNLGRLILGNEAIVPATPKGILHLLDAYQIQTEGQHVVIVGRSMILGKPLAAMFLNRNATVTVCHSKTTDLKQYTQMADIVVMDTGIPQLLTGSMVKTGSIVIDAGISRLASGELVGDVVFYEVAAKVHAITPVPGGVGPMTIAALLENTIELTEQSMVESKQ